MKNIMMKVSALMLSVAVYNFCFPMISVFKKDHSQRLSNDSLVYMADRAPLSTKLRVRATCRDLERKIKVDEIEKARLLLARGKVFYIDPLRLVDDKYLTGDFTKARADQLNLTYRSNAFSADGTLTRNSNGSVVDDELRMSLYQYVLQNDSTLMQDFQDLKTAFSFTRATGDFQWQKDTMFTHIPNNRYGLKHVFGMGIVRSAIFGKDWDFAGDLLKTNPYGFCGGRDNRKNPELREHVRSSYGGDISPADKNLLWLTQLSQSQPYYYEKNHDHCTIL